MKKSTIIIFLLMCFFYVHAQEGFKAAIFLGPVTSQVDGDNHAGYNKFGFNGGISVNFFINEAWSYNTEITYIQKGSVANDAKNNIYYRLKLNYVEVPVYFTYRYLKSKKLKKVSFDLGGTVAYLFKDGEDKNGYGLLDPDPPMKDFDFNILADVNYDLNESWKVSIRFQYSIFPIKDAEKNPFKDIGYRGQYNNLFALNLYKYF